MLLPALLYLECGALPPLFFFPFCLYLECGALPPLFFFRFLTNNKRNNAAEKRRTPKKPLLTAKHLAANVRLSS
ncbi:MAG TPA: hypothetical protein VMG10_17725, partial [Gemmataceae bacterium]|nr:hypothetical protein [Gemmataceae bacterium]